MLHEILSAREKTVTPQMSRQVNINLEPPLQSPSRRLNEAGVHVLLRVSLRRTGNTTQRHRQPAHPHTPPLASIKQDSATLLPVRPLLIIYSWFQDGVHLELSASSPVRHLPITLEREEARLVCGGLREVARKVKALRRTQNELEGWNC